MIHLQQLVWRREDRDIIREVDLHLNAGEHWTLLGRNGCGKTTLLEMINGYLFPTSGTIDILGHRYGDCDVREVRKQIGYISSSLIEKLTLRDPVWEIVAGGYYAFLRIYEEVPTEVREQAYAELTRVGIRHLAEQPFGTLSQGERKKVLLARMMMHVPKLLILDEPCSGLDYYEREKYLEALTALGESKLSMLYVTHHIEEIIPIFTHVALMAEGQIIASGPKKDVLTPQFLRGAYDVDLAVEWRDERPWVVVGKGVPG